MPNITDVIWSKTEDGGTRQTTSFNDGTSTDKTLERDSSFTVTDHSPDGNSKTYDGVAGICGTFSSVSRLRERQ